MPEHVFFVGCPAYIKQIKTLNAPLGESAESPPMRPWILKLDSPCRVK